MIKKINLRSRKIVIIVSAFLIVVAASAPAYYFYNQNQKSQALLKNPTQATTEEVKILVDQVGKLMELPTNESPTIATVSDKTKLAGQSFFAKAENGDKVLIYNQVKKAILYRPSINKIIEVAPVDIGSSTATGSGQAALSQTQPLRVVLLNGTTTTGLTRTVEADLKSKLTNIEVVLKENAKKNDYTKTLVIDISGIKKEVALQVAEVLGGEVAELPDGETRPDADILVIIGKDEI